MLDAGRQSMTVHRTLSAPLALMLVAALAASTRAHAQTGAPTAGQSVNMVSGTEWPGGDPFLQRDNEPSLAVSSVNVERLLAGANSYRTVDLPFPPGASSETGDAWLGIYKSFDAGRTWKTTLLPGFPQDTSDEGAASPLRQRGLRAAADPTVRAGTHGLFLMNGIAFNRQTNDGVVFVSRFIDLDVKENGDASQGLDTMPYVDTVLVDTGNAGQFLDKPWVAIDIPRPFASGTCTITANLKRREDGSVVATPVTRTFPVGPMYVAWSRFTGSQSTKIMVSRSLDCGKTWQTPTKVSEGNSINQGTALAIDPQTGALYVAWRRFATSSQTDAILVARSTDGGRTFPGRDTNEIATIVPFDQGTTATSFRTNALPTIAVSVAGTTSRVHVAWSQRPSLGADARVVVSTSQNGGSTWSPPTAVDDGPAADEFGIPYSTDDPSPEELTRGHQVMPQMTFSAGKLVVVYYDLRLDHTVGVFKPKTPFEPDAEGRFYEETREKAGDLVSTPGAVYKPYIDDAQPTATDTGLTIRRHTIDVRVAQADPGPSPAWTSAPVSRFPFGTRPEATGTIETLEQLKFNPPNLPIFQQGTVPFMGDYIDVAGEAFYAAGTPQSKPWCAGTWCYRVEAQGSPVHYATWTSNEDVRPPADGDWTNYTPVGGGGQSVYDPSQATPDCLVGQEGMRNQNVYASRITQGLLVSSPQASKPLRATDERAFVVVVENATPKERVFRLSIAAQPTGGRASFLASTSEEKPEQCAATTSAPGGGPLASCTALLVTVPARSGAARSVFAKSTDATAKITVNAEEWTSAVGGSAVAGGLSGFVLLNAVPVGALASPDGAGNIEGGEVYQPAITFINISNPNVSNVNVSNPNVSNVNVSNINVSNPNVSNVNVSNPNVSNINVSNVNVSNVNVSNINISNPNISNVNVSNQAITDASYAVTNTGNTTHSYHVQLVGQQPGTTPIQLILTKPYSTPAANGCELGVSAHDATLASIPLPLVESPDSLGDPNIPDPSQANATLSLAPGETAVVTIRALADLNGMRRVVSQLAPAIVAHGHNGSLHPFAALLLVTTSSEDLPAATVGAAYEVQLTSVGGTAPVQWSVTGTLPPGLSLEPTTGLVSGTPTSAGTFVATVLAEDGSSPAQTAERELTIVVSRRSTATTVLLAPASIAAGASSLATVTVVDTQTTGTASSPQGDVVVSGGGLNGGSCTLVASGAGASSCSVSVYAPSPGSFTVSAAYGGSISVPLVHSGSSGTAALSVGKAPTTTTITSDTPDPSTSGQAVTVTVAVGTTSTGLAAPTGTVLVTDGAGLTCSITLPNASCTLASASPGTRDWTATYSGDGLYSGGSGTASHTVNAPPSLRFTGFLTPLKTASAYPRASLSGSWTFSRVLPIKWQIKDASGNAVTSAGAVASLIALYSGATCTTADAPPLPPASTDVAVLYTPASGAAGGSDFRPGTTYNFNWDATKNARKGCWSLVLELADGSRWATKVQLK